jgi:hypothetical protein
MVELGGWTSRQLSTTSDGEILSVASIESKMYRVPIARHLRASFTVTNTHVGGQPVSVQGGRGSDSA